MRFIKYKHEVLSSSTLIVKQNRLEDSIGKVKYKFGYGKMNNQDISIIPENIISEYNDVESLEELFEKYPEALI